MAGTDHAASSASRHRGCWFCLGAAAAGLGAIGLAALLWWRNPGIDLAPWQHGAPPHPWATWERQEARWHKEGTQQRTPEHVYLPLAEIGATLPLAVLVSEDSNFFGHGAVDFAAVSDALREQHPGGRLRGASTVSQQLARTLFLSGERTLMRKLKEARLAAALERELSKRRILELYLNVIEFAPGVYGCEAACQHYYGISVRDADAEEAAGLAAAVPSPARDNPATATARWRTRSRLIRTRMDQAVRLREQVQRLIRAGD
jgi:monofunctional biosynthetic peptidoglycan transglycosylase